MQKGALEAVKVWHENCIEKKYEINCKISINELIEKSTFSDYCFLKHIGDMHFLEDQICYVAKPKTLYEYLTNPRQFIEDFGKAVWKTGFLKRFFKINLPYYLLYSK